MAAEIRNPYTVPVALPYPFRGVLAPGKAVVVDLSPSQVITAFGGEELLGGLKVSAAVGASPKDAAFKGGADPSNGPLTVHGKLTVDGSIEGDADIQGNIGGVRQQVGPFELSAISAGQSDAPLNLGSNQLEYLTQRAGSILNLSVVLSAAPQDGNVTFKVRRNGAVQFATIDFGALNTQDTAAAAKDDHPITAGDKIDVVYDSDAGLSNTPGVTAFVGFET